MTEWKDGNLKSGIMQNNGDWENINVFRFRTQDLIEHACTTLTTNVHISLEIGEFGLEIIVEKNLWVKCPENRFQDPQVIKPVTVNPIASDEEGNTLARVRVFEKCWFFKEPVILKNVPPGVDKYEIMTWIQLLRTATGKNAIDAARHLFWLLEIQPAWHDENHWIRKVLPKYWNIWENRINNERMQSIREVMTT